MSDVVTPTDCTDSEFDRESSDGECNSSSESGVDDEERSFSESGKKRKKDIALTKLCVGKLCNIIGDERGNISADNVETKVFEYLDEWSLKLMSKNREIKQRELDLKPQEEIMVDSIPVYYCQLVVTSKKKGVAGRTDKNNGEIWFVYWGTSPNDVTLYSFNRSGFSGAWRLLSNFRDCSFPKDFARVFLSPSKIQKITINNLIGVSSSSRTLTYSKDTLFNPYHVTKEYGMVKNFTTCVEEEKHPELKSMLNTGKEAALVAIQTGQIKLPLTVTDTKFEVNEHLKLLLLIKRKIDENKDECKDDLRWRFLEYIEFVIDKDLKEKLNNKLRKEMFEYLREDICPTSFDPEATLWHHHQDTFYNCSYVKLFYKLCKLFWSSNTTERKGISIKTKDVFCLLYTSPSPRDS